MTKDAVIACSVSVLHNDRLRRDDGISAPTDDPIPAVNTRLTRHLITAVSWNIETFAGRLAD